MTLATTQPSQSPPPQQPAPPAPPASSHQAAQTGLTIALAAELATAWPSLDISNLKGSLPGFTQLIAALVRKYGAASATLAARYYLGERVAAGVRSKFTVHPAPLPGLSQIGAGVDWATQPLWSVTPDIPATQTLLDGVAEKLVLDVGRATVTSNIQRDPKARGWARITEPQPCAFCALLAIRGFVYRSEHTAEFKSHSACRCHVAALFGPYQPTEQVMAWEKLYYESTSGGSGQKVRRDWRRAYDAQVKAQQTT